MKLFVLLCCFLATGFTSSAADILKGIVKDAATNEPLQGATVKLIDSKGKTVATTISGLDGTFIFRNIDKTQGAEYKIAVSYSGYASTELPFSVKEQGTVPSFAISRSEKEMNTVTVTARTDKGTDAAAITAERKADNITNVVSARTIEVSPDLSVANVTQRVSGVSLQRSGNGEGQYAIVRGMDKRYNYTLVNGIKIPSTDNKNRYVPLDIFPAELLERLEVTKALTPNMEGDAIGGVVNMVMKDAPAKFILNANGAVTYAQRFAEGDKFIAYDHTENLIRSPRSLNGDDYLASDKDFPKSSLHYYNKNAVGFNGGFSIGSRILKNKLGLLLAASSQESYRDVQSLFFSTETNRVDNSPSFQSVQRRNYSIHQQRSGLHGVIDFVINKNHKLKFYAAYLNLTQEEYRFSSDTNLVLGRVGAGSGRIGNSYRTTTQDQRIYNTTLKGDHTIGKLQINWSAVYSKATGNQPDRTSLELTTGVVKDATGNLQQQKVYIDNSTFRDWTRNSDEDKSAYLNFTYKSVLASVKLDWSVGVMYRNKDRVSSYDKYNLRPSPSPQEYLGNIDANSFAVFNPQGTSTDPLNYTATEKIAGYYAMVKTEKGKFQILAGARAEHTDFNWVTAAPITVEGSSGSIKYYDVLPSVHVKYHIASKQFIRASYFSSISRPGFYEVIPHTYIDPNTDYPEQGNPMLKRTTAENFDLRYEYFPKGLDQLLAGVFYKEIKNPIEYAIVQAGAGQTYYTPYNFGTGSNYGFEMDVTKYFHSFGIKANYTFTESRITTSKIRRFQQTDASGGTSLTQENVQQTRPLQGQSKNIANLSLLYKNSKRGVDAQFALVYTGERINTVSPFLDNDLWQKGFVQADVSAEIRLVKHFYVFAKANNIFNTAYQLEIHQQVTDSKGIPEQEAGKNAFVRKDIYGANYLLGFRFKL